MSDQEFNRLARWGIPGWVAILSLLAFLVIDLVASVNGPNSWLPDLQTFLAGADRAATAIAALVVAAAGVPLGFAIYQAYFFVRWNSPFSREGLLPPLIVGRMQDLARILRDWKIEESISSLEWREKWIKNPLFHDDHGWRSRYIELLFTEAAQGISSKYSGIHIYSRSRYLQDVMHTLGASLGGVYLGFLSYTAVKVILHHAPEQGHLILLMLFWLCLNVLLEKEDQANIELEKGNYLENEKVKTIRAPININTRFLKLSFMHPGALFITFLVFIHLFCNPILGNSSQSPDYILFKLFVAVFTILAWHLGTRGLLGTVHLGEDAALLVALAASILLRDSKLVSSLDWPFLTCAGVFLGINLIVLKNRQNARNDLNALEYYTIRLYYSSGIDQEFQKKVPERVNANDLAPAQKASRKGKISRNE